MAGAPGVLPSQLHLCNFARARMFFFLSLDLQRACFIDMWKKKNNRKNKDITSSVYVNITSIGLKRGREPIVLDTAQIFSKKQL